jgi:hypothetical protein
MEFDNTVDHINNKIHTSMIDMSYEDNLLKINIKQLYKIVIIPPARCISDEHFGHFLAFHCSSFF